MSEPVQTPEPPPESLKKPDDAPGKADAIAIGIGCLIVVVFFAAIVLVGILRE